MTLLSWIIGRFRRKKFEPPEDVGAETAERDLGMPARRAMATDFPEESRMSSGDNNTMILTKLDMISIKLDNLDRRVQYIEKVAKESEK